jgi:hypothetical protein
MKLFLRYLVPLLSLVLLTLGIFYLAPQRLELSNYKAMLLAQGFCLGWMLDHVCVPYARPHGYLIRRWTEKTGFRANLADYAVAPGCEWLFITACLRRAGSCWMGMWVMGAGL